MPSAPCHHPTCSAIVARRGDYCAEHAHLSPSRAEANAAYDRFHRDRDAKAFYNSAEWDRARRLKLATDPICQRCRKAWAVHVHHVIPLKYCDAAQRVAQENLEGLCQPCHSAEEASRR